MNTRNLTAEVLRTQLADASQELVRARLTIADLRAAIHRAVCDLGYEDAKDLADREHLGDIIERLAGAIR
jgi:glutathione S-transferase